MTDVAHATDTQLATWRSVIDERLGSIAPAVRGLPAHLVEPVHYSLTGGGKRLRGLLVCAAYDALGGHGNPVGLAAAVEVVHAYSLVHDDLPCMDNDHTRRGRPTTHVAFGVARATVVGAVMVPIAVHEVLRGSAALDLPEDTTLQLVRILMRASGAGGMVGGQLLDLLGEGGSLPLPEVEALHRAKTGALIAASLEIGARAALRDADAGDADAGELAALAAAGDSLGLAFQIADDVLDATATSEDLGKTAGQDAALAKSTYATLLGVPAARHRRDQLVDQAMEHLEQAKVRTPPLERLARFVAARRS